MISLNQFSGNDKWNGFHHETMERRGRIRTASCTLGGYYASMYITGAFNINN